MRLTACLITALAFLSLTAHRAHAQPPTQEQLQAVLNAAITKADLVTVEHEFMPWVKCPNEKLRRMSICELTAKGEIAALKGYFLLRVPAAKKEVVDGVEQWSREMFAVDTPDVFELRLSKNAKPLLKVVILGGDCISSPELVEDSAIRVDKESLAPLYGRLKMFLNIKIRANQALVPTATSVTPASDAAQL